MPIAVLVLIGICLVIGFSHYCKKSDLDKYYSRQLEIGCKGELDSKTQKWGENRLLETEVNMLQDGYNRAEIQQMMFKAYDEAFQNRDRLESLVSKNRDASSIKS